MRNKPLTLSALLLCPLNVWAASGDPSGLILHALGYLAVFLFVIVDAFRKGGWCLVGALLFVSLPIFSLVFPELLALDIAIIFSVFNFILYICIRESHKYRHRNS